MAHKCYVGNIPFDATSEEVRNFFEQAPNPHKVASVNIIYDRETKRPRGFAFVEFDSRDELLAAIRDLDGSELGGRKIVVNEARDREPRRESRGGGSDRSRHNGNQSRGRGRNDRHSNYDDDWNS